MSFFHSIFAVPSFPAYTGPYSVGTRELEIPASELSSPSPDNSIATFSYRIFYPCSPDTDKNKARVYWLPDPQHDYFAAYARFLRASPWLATLLSYFPLLRPLFYTTIPAIPSAPLLPSPNRWPVSIFSHGLGGSKNAYSALCGSLASHGLVVVALDHRDGSTPISFIRTSAGTFKDAKRVEFRRLGHAGGEKVDRERDGQLKVRCWELGAAWETLAKVDRGEAITDLTVEGGHAAPEPWPPTLEDWKEKFDVHSPGRVAWIGHSFGATTVAQFIKSVAYYRDGSDESLLAHPPSPALRKQITPASPTVFLDLWAQPAKSVHMQSLAEKPLPCYTTKSDGNNHTNATPAAAASEDDAEAAAVKATAPLAILSESFYNWKPNLEDTIRIISPPPLPPPSSKSPPPSTPLSSPLPSPSPPTNSTLKPHIFYPPHSAHLSQSDFGTLFPWFTRRVFKAEDPRRTIVLNVRAILEVLRRAGYGGAGGLADTSSLDMELADEDGEEEGKVLDGEGREEDKRKRRPDGFSDEAILDTSVGKVRGWVAVPLPVPVPGQLELESGLEVGGSNGGVGLE